MVVEREARTGPERADLFSPHVSYVRATASAMWQVVHTTVGGTELPRTWTLWPTLRLVETVRSLASWNSNRASRILQ